MFETIDSLKLMGVMIKVDEEVYMNVNENDWKWMTMEEMEKMKKWMKMKKYLMKKDGWSCDIDGRSLKSQRSERKQYLMKFACAIVLFHNLYNG